MKAFKRLSLTYETKGPCGDRVPKHILVNLAAAETSAAASTSAAAGEAPATAAA